MIRGHRLLASVALAGTLSGCSAPGRIYDELAGALSSGDAPPVYLQMTESDVTMANAALDSALESRISGAPLSWRNLATGNHGSITPLATFRGGDGSFCRRYREELVVGGRRGRFEDVACRKGRRLWIPIES